MGDQGAWREFVRRLLAVDACAVSDAQDKLGLSNRAVSIPRRSGDGRIAGRVVTVKLGVGDPPPGPPRHLGVAAIEAAGPQEIIVVEQTTGVEAGSWGGLLTLAAKVKGVEGVIADGPLRDVDEARSHGFPIFATSLTARTARGRVVEKGANVPIVICGQNVAPGDFVIADGGAVVFIAAADIERVLGAAEAIVKRETDMARALSEGVSPSDVMSGAYEHMLKRD